MIRWQEYHGKAPGFERYAVIYLWNGERHRADSGLSLADARKLVAEFLADGWQAWLEPLNGG